MGGGVDGDDGLYDNHLAHTMIIDNCLHIYGKKNCPVYCPYIKGNVELNISDPSGK